MGDVEGRLRPGGATPAAGEELPDHLPGEAEEVAEAAVPDEVAESGLGGGAVGERGVVHVFDPIRLEEGLHETSEAEGVLPSPLVAGWQLCPGRGEGGLLCGGEAVTCLDHRVRPGPGHDHLRVGEAGEVDGVEAGRQVESLHGLTLSGQKRVCTRKVLDQRMTQLLRMLIALAPAMALKRPSEAPSVMALVQAPT